MEDIIVAYYAAADAQVVVVEGVVADFEQAGAWRLRRTIERPTDSQSASRRRIRRSQTRARTSHLHRFSGTKPARCQRQSHRLIDLNRPCRQRIEHR